MNIYLIYVIEKHVLNTCFYLYQVVEILYRGIIFLFTNFFISESQLYHFILWMHVNMMLHELMSHYNGCVMFYVPIIH